MTELQDKIYMQRALRLARRGLGRVAPNPAVGCLIVRDGCVLGEGRTGNAGRPHAETVAIAMALAEQPAGLTNLHGATAYVTLEPCAHHGQTGPCAQALIDAAVSRVVVAVQDPDPRVSGRGVEMMRAAGLDVTVGVCETEAHELNAGFMLKITDSRPMVTLKIAVSRNGMMRRTTGENPAITSVQAQRRMHLIRAEHDAILVGAGTFCHDAPSLTCRLPGMSVDSPLPYVASCTLQQNDLPGGWRLLSQQAPADMLCALASDGVTRLMLEGGPHLAKAFLSAGLVDRLAVFVAPFDLPLLPMAANNAPKQSDLQFMGIDNYANSSSFNLISTEICGADSLRILHRS
ncbi:MAG: bifunctional diaminohydroxyphosphoribosylaminopyrimidine deaminase/5-amino-6-(5-phosphoribosylamino)uracil reductase RibD [Parvibaculales bacterium]